MVVKIFHFPFWPRKSLENCAEYAREMWEPSPPSIRHDRNCHPHRLPSELLHASGLETRGDFIKAQSGSVSDFYFIDAKSIPLPVATPR